MRACVCVCYKRKRKNREKKEKPKDLNNFRMNNSLFYFLSGLVSYREYWRDVILDYLSRVLDGDVKKISIKAISEETSINAYDIIRYDCCCVVLWCVLHCMCCVVLCFALRVCVVLCFALCVCLCVYVCVCVCVALTF